MKIYPAIDLRGGRVVRLSKGDYDQMTVYDLDPAQVAEDYLRAGAKYLHVVDLDAAKDGTQVNLPVIREILSVGGLFVEVGGGCRDEASVERYLDASVNRAIIGSAAVEKPGFLEKMAANYPGRVAAGVDAKDGKIAIHGWRTVTDVDAFEFMKNLPAIGVDTVIYTDISRDGMLMGTNMAAYRETREIAGLQVIASGGVSYESEIEELAGMGIYGAIIGKALYSGKIDLQRALRLAGE